jgi:hypothetical protein
MDHEADELLEVFNKKQLLDFYINGCELRLRMEYRLKDFNNFNKETGISFGNLISNKYNLAKQLNVLKICLEKLGVQGIEETEHIMLNN